MAEEHNVPATQGPSVLYFDVCGISFFSRRGFRWADFEIIAERFGGKYKNIYLCKQNKALKLCLEDTITDGKGMGFGLYTTSRLVDSIGKEFILHSGTHKLMIKDGETSVIENGFWQGTLIYMEIGTGEEIDPNLIVDYRASVVEEYNETFVETEELESLW